MKFIKQTTTALILASFMMLSGCSSDNASAVLITPDENTTIIITPPDENTTIITASDYIMTLDVNKISVSSNWKVDANTTGVSATVTTQGNYGNCVLNDTSITYTKTSENNITDFCIVSINNSVDINVSINVLYWKQVSGGQNQTVALKSDGTIWAWGDNSTTASLVPVQENSNTTNWSSVTTGNSHIVAIKKDGTLWAWGDNAFGQLGDNNKPTDSLIPVQEDSNATNWSSANAGKQHTVAIKSDGTLWAWGRNYNGQLGDNSTTDKYKPVQEDSNATNWSSVNAGLNHTVAIKSDGTLWAWGYNGDGQLGDNSTTDKYKPVQEDSSATNWSSVSAGESHTVALKSNGTIWAWGLNVFGQLGDNTSIDSSIPVQEFTNATNWNSVTAGSVHTVAIKSNGTIWAWGDNDFGQLGDNSTADSLVPTQENRSDIDWSSVSAGLYHTVAIKSDGIIWSWGRNTDGQLGNDSITDSLIPILPITRN